MAKTTKSKRDEDIKIEYNVVELDLNKERVLLKCPFCKATGHTVTSPKVGINTWLWCIGICLVGGVLGCCLIPFFMKCSRDVEHQCFSCHKCLGRYDKVRGKPVKC